MKWFGFLTERSAAVSSSTSRSAGAISNRCGWSSTQPRSTAIRERGSTGHWPAPSGYQPDGTRATVRIKDDGLSVTSVAAVPIGRLPTGAGKLPALPIFKTRSNRMVNAAACAADWEKLPSEH